MLITWVPSLCLTLFCLQWASAAGYEAPTQLMRALQDANIHKRSDLQANSTFSRSWDGATLLKFATTQSTKPNNQTTVSSTEAINVACKKCYVQGLAKAQLHIPDDLNINNVLDQTISAVSSKINNVTQVVENSIVNYFEGLESEIVEYFEDHGFMSAVDAVKNSNVNDLPYALPQMNISLDVGVSSISQVILGFEFDGLDIYMEMDTALDEKVQYDYNLYTSDTPMGIGIGGSNLGITFTIDLILSADGAIDISNGFHLRFEDGLGFNIALFDNTVATLIHRGGKFETLPVIVESAGVLIHATIRLGVHAGINYAAPTSLPTITIANETLNFGIGGGIETSVYLNLADLITNVTYHADDHDCSVRASEQFQLAIGAAAGASVQAAGHTWGPVANKQIAIFTTTLADACAKQTTVTFPTPTVTQHAGLTTTSTKTVVTYTGVRCQSSVIGDCPASLQSTTRTTETLTLTTAVGSGTKATWPKTPGVADAVVTTMPLSNAMSFASTSGSPAPYTATSTPDTSQVINALLADAPQTRKSLILGLVLGLGLPVLIAAIAAAVFIIKRRRQYSAVTTRAQVDERNSDDHLENDPALKIDRTTTQVRELRYF